MEESDVTVLSVMAVIVANLKQEMTDFICLTVVSNPGQVHSCDVSPVHSAV